MSDGGLTVLDGSHVRALDLSLPESDGIFTGAQLLQTAESRASSSLFGLSLPDYLKTSAIKRLKIGDLVGFRRSELDRDEAASILRDYVSAIADELKEDPLVVAVLDGKTLRLFLEDEDDFAMLAENLFTDLDAEDKGKINKNEITNALVHMGVELGIPPFSEFPQLHNMIEKHGADKEEQLGQAQFAELLQQVLQELADVLAKNHLVVIQKIKLVNGSKIRNILASDDKMKAITEKMLQKKNDSVKDLQTTDIVRDFLEENEKDLGLPSSKSHESVALLYDEVCTDAGNINKVPQSKDEIHLLVENILEKLSEKLEANPVFQDLDD